MEFHTSTGAIISKIYVQNLDSPQLISCIGIFNKMTIIQNYYYSHHENENYEICIYTNIDGTHFKYSFTLKIFKDDKCNNTFRTEVIHHPLNDDHTENVEIDSEIGLIVDKYIEVDKTFIESLIFDTIINDPHYMGEYNNMNVMFSDFGFKIPKSLFNLSIGMCGCMNIDKNNILLMVIHNKYNDGVHYEQCHHQHHLKLDLCSSKQYELDDILVCKCSCDDIDFIKPVVINIASLFSEYIINHNQRTKPLILPMIII